MASTRSTNSWTVTAIEVPASPRPLRGTPDAQHAVVKVTMDLRAVVARMLAVAELDLQLAQQQHNGSDAARRRYARARADLETAEALALELVDTFAELLHATTSSSSWPPRR